MMTKKMEATMLLKIYKQVTAPQLPSVTMPELQMEHPFSQITSSCSMQIAANDTTLFFNL